MKILLLIGLCLIISVPAFALECNETKTVFSNGESFSLKQTCDDGFDWRFSHISTGTTNQQFFEMLTGKTGKELVEQILGKSCNTFSADFLEKDIVVCQ